jgi:ABC-type multidrug transport system ATPase subunit
MLSVEGVCKAFGKDERRLVVLHEVGFVLQPGAALGVVGPNGCGKTTLLRVTASVILPDRGTVLLEGRPVSEPAVRRTLGYGAGPQAAFPQRLSGAQNLRLAGLLYGMRRSEFDQNLERLSVALGMESYLERPVSAYSSGQRACLRLCWALIHRPRLVLLDEPLSNLDEQRAQAAVLLLREELAREACLLIASHSGAEVRQLGGGLLDLGRAAE